MASVPTPSPVTSGAGSSSSSDDTSSSSLSRSLLVAEPEPVPTPDAIASTPRPVGSKKKPRAAAASPNDPVAQRAAYLAKRREIKARARARYKATASSLTDQYALLQRQLTAALATYHDHTRAILNDNDTLGDRDQLQQLWDAYVDALALDEAITKENQHLVDRIDEFLLVECRLLLPEFHPDASDDSVDTESLERGTTTATTVVMDPTDSRGYWTHFHDEHDALFYFRFYRPHECNVVIARAFATMQRDMTQTWAFATGCYGWHGFGNIDSDDATRVQFQFCKTLTRASSSDLMDDMTRETSRIFHSPTRYAKLYGMRMESQVLQRVDDHTSVLFQALSDEHRVVSLRSFMLFSCVEERLPPTTASHGQPRRAMTILNVVLPPRPQDVAPHNDPQRTVLYMTECLIYMRLEQVDTHQLTVTYGGHAHCLSPELARICVLESVSSFFRWVQHVIPERLVACN